MAAALLEMAAAFAGDSEAAARAASLRGQLVRDGERELRSYEPVLEALRVSREDPARAERVAGALSDASDAPLAIARASAEVAEMAVALVGQSKPSLAGDAIAAVVVAEAATRAAARLVEINLRDATDDPRLEEVDRLARRAASARERSLGYSSPTCLRIETESE